MTPNEIMKLGDVLHELDNTADSILNIIRVLRSIPGKDHDPEVDALYKIHDDIHNEMERLANGVVRMPLPDLTEEVKNDI